MAIRVDVLVVGAGPAGTAVALHLLPNHDVALLERSPSPPMRIGESLPGAAIRCLRVLGLADAFEALRFPRWRGNVSCWGDEASRETDALLSPDGPGWYLDRPRFEAWLRAETVQRGARMLSGAQAERITPLADGFEVLVRFGSGARERIRARLLVDASGRRAVVARQLGARRRRFDRLAAIWARLPSDGLAVERGLNRIAATADGWWYVAPVTDDCAVVAFHTDADLLRRTAEARSLLRLRGHRVSDASGALLEPVAGQRWLAVGDAAMSFDPLASQGLLNALATAHPAAVAIRGQLSGDLAAVAAYADRIQCVAGIYRRRLAVCYAEENRFAERAFWRRRRQPKPALVPGEGALFRNPESHQQLP